MEIRRLTIAGLDQLMHSDEIAHWSSLPISPLRLLSQMKNPQLESEDIVMIIAVENNELAGYIGALPDQMKVEGSLYHVAWASCLWTDPACRGKGLAKKLTAAMTEAWNGKLFLTEFTAGAKAVYDSLGLFDTFCIKTGYRYFYKGIFYAVARNRYGPNAFMTGLAWLADMVINFFLRQRTSGKLLLGKKTTYSIMESSVEDLTEDNCPESPFIHNTEKNKWIFLKPWLSSEKANACDRYYFQTLVNCFQFRSVSFCGTDHLPLARLFFSRVNNDCKVLSFSIETNIALNDIGLKRDIERFFVTEGVNAVLSYDEEYNKLMEQKGRLFFLRKSRKREYLAGKDFFRQLPALKYAARELDGDIVFT